MKLGEDIRISPNQVRQAVEGSGGWVGDWAKDLGLYRQLVEAWERSGSIPRVWRVVLKDALKAVK